MDINQKELYENNEYFFVSNISSPAIISCLFFDYRKIKIAVLLRYCFLKREKLSKLDIDKAVPVPVFWEPPYSSWMSNRNCDTCLLRTHLSPLLRAVWCGRCTNL
jgi:hypothetical protein